MYLTKELLDTFAHEVAADPIHKAVAGAVARVGLEEAALNTEVARQHTHIFSTETKRGEMTNQKNEWSLLDICCAQRRACKHHEKVGH